MNLNQKETTLLKDLRDQEQLCVDKYARYSDQACAGELKNLFASIRDVEKSHLDSINSTLNGTEPKKPSSYVDQTGCGCGCVNYDDGCSKECDKYLCQDALATEKHASSLYNTCIFEFADTAVRNRLNHIQSEEQKHGELIYSYMSKNGMYC